MSFGYEVLTGRDPKWYGNSVRFATREEANSAGLNKLMAWTACEDFRVIESSDPANYAIRDGMIVCLDA
jgi:hypothetical protein